MKRANEDGKLGREERNEEGKRRRERRKEIFGESKAEDKKGEEGDRKDDGDAMKDKKGKRGKEKGKDYSRRECCECRENRGT